MDIAYLPDPDIVYLTIENANKEGMSDEERYQELMEHKSSGDAIGGEVYRSDDAGSELAEDPAPTASSIGGAAALLLRPDPGRSQRFPTVVYVLSIRT
jgi:uncharacterized protein YuzE